MICPIVKDVCLSSLPCEKCSLYIEYILDLDCWVDVEDDESECVDDLDFIDDLDDEDLVSFVNFENEDEIDLDDLPF